MNKRMLVTLILSVFVLGSLFAYTDNKPENYTAPAVTSDANPDSHQRVSQGTASREMWDIQFNIEIEPASATATGTGCETDGTYFYTTDYQSDVIYKWDLEGNLIESFTITGVQNLRDLAYDGTYFYGGDVNNYIWQMDFNNQTLISTISTPAAVRSISYDEDADAFWINNWSEDLRLINRDGEQIGTIASPPSIYGTAWDNYSQGGPYLWLFSGTSSATYTCQVEQYNLDGTATGVVHEVHTALGDGGIAGALWVQAELVPGKATLGGLFQAETNGDRIFGFELCDTAPLDAPGAPANFVITPDAGGALSAGLTWSNPTTTSSGANLTELTEMRVYRGETLIHTITNPTIGGNESWTDTGVPAAGEYDYSVVGVNSEGSGIPATGSAWIGEDVPASPTDLVLTSDDGAGLLTWMNPTTGLHGGSFNEPIQGYTLYRSDGVQIDISGITTTYTDDTIPTDNNYYYTLTPYNSVGEGGSAVSNTVWLGSSVGVQIGFDTTTANTVPIDYFYKNSLSETIYMGSELAAGGITGGALTHLVYYYNFTEVPVTPTITIWVGETDQTSLNSTWIPAGDLTQVYSGDPEFQVGEGEVVIVLDDPYMYMGQNLVVMVHRPMDTEYYDSTDYFYYTETPDFPGRTVEKHNDSTVFDPFAPPESPASLDRVPNTLLLFDTEGMGSIEGYVYDSVGNPVADAQVTIDDLGVTRNTNALGMYTFPAVFAGTYDMTAAKFGYGSQNVTGVTVTADVTTQQDFTLPDLLQVEVTGFVQGSELPGTGLADCVVSLDGYENYETTTGADGTFTFPAVYANNTYDITITHDGYTTHQGEAVVAGTDIDLGTFTLIELMLPINGLHAQVLGNDVHLSWNEPVNAYFWDFEDNNGDFVADPLTGGWGWGADENFGANSGTNVWSTIPNATYPNDQSWTLDTPEIAIPDGAQLTFWHSYQMETCCDGGNVKISTDGGENWEIITPIGGYPQTSTSTSNIGIPGEPCFANSTLVPWEMVTFELTDYYNTTAILRFHFGTDYSVVYPGWAIDDVRVGPPEERVHLGYKIYRNTTLLDTVTPDVLTYDDLDLDDGTYTYDITAYYTSGESDPQSVTVAVYPTSVTGWIDLSDNAGVGADGVLVELWNDDFYYQDTTEDGDFVLNDVFGDGVNGVTYNFKAELEGYQPYETEVIVYDADIDMGDIQLVEYINPASNVIAVENGANVELIWTMPGNGVDGIDEDFDDGTADNWILQDDRFSVSDGYLKMNGTSSATWACAYYEEPFSNYTLEYEVQREQSSSTTTASICCFIQSDGFMGTGSENGYLLNITSGGSYSIWRMDNGSSTSIIGWTSSAAINTTLGESNIITVVANSPNYEMYVNGTLVHSFSDATFTEGLVNIGCHDSSSGTNEIWWNYVLLVDESDVVPTTVAQAPQGEMLKGTCTGVDERCVQITNAPVPAVGFLQDAVATRVSEDNIVARNTEATRDRSIEHFWVYRLLQEDQGNPDEWVLLTDTGSPADSVYTDDDWDTQPSGTYEWAVLAEYTGGILSTPAFSNTLDHGTMGNVEVTVTCDDESTPNGATLVFENFDGVHNYQQTVPANGIVNFEAWMGDYTVTCTLSGYELWESVGFTVLPQQVNELAIELNELTPPVVEFTYTYDQDAQDVYMQWLDPFTVTGWTEDFEGGAIPDGWVMETLASGTDPGWFITQDGSSTNWTIPAGDGYYACSNDDITNPSDGSMDYLITPPQDLSNASEMSITFDSYFGDCYSQVATFEYSTDNGNSWNIIETMAAGTSGAWDEITINLDDYCGAGFDNVMFAFHSDDAGGWMYGWAVDNVVFGSGGEQATVQLTRKQIAERAETINTRELQGYHIEMEDANGNVTVLADLITDLEFFYHFQHQGTYVVSVYASYTTGLSEPMMTDELVALVAVDPNDVPPVVTELGNNFPNPFNPETNVSFSLAEAGDVSIDIYNVRGQRVRTLVNEHMEAGAHSIVWNGTDDNNRSVGSGIFFYKMRAGRYTATKKMILLK